MKWSLDHHIRLQTIQLATFACYICVHSDPFPYCLFEINTKTTIVQICILVPGTHDVQYILQLKKTLSLSQ